MAAVVGLASSAVASGDFDFGRSGDLQLRAHATLFFGLSEPLSASSTESVDQGTAEADPTSLATVAHGLDVQVASSQADLGSNIDMIALWPDAAHPTHLIVCNEVDDVTLPGVQMVRLSDGSVETILRGTISCDPVRRTAWGTIVVGEENGSTGQVIEIIRPLETTEVFFDRVTGLASGGTGAANVARRRALGRLSFEGLALYPSG